MHRGQKGFATFLRRPGSLKAATLDEFRGFFRQSLCKFTAARLLRDLSTVFHRLAGRCARSCRITSSCHRQVCNQQPESAAAREGRLVCVVSYTELAGSFMLVSYGSGLGCCRCASCSYQDIRLHQITWRLGLFQAGSVERVSTGRGHKPRLSILRSKSTRSATTS